MHHKSGTGKVLNAGLSASADKLCRFKLPLSAVSSQVQKDKSKACGFTLESVGFYAVGDFSVNLMFSAP